MNDKQVREVVDYWRKTAAHDYGTMLVLYEHARYSDSLFFGHIVIEKILKGLVVQATKQPAPYIHDLSRLAKLAQLDCTAQELDLLDAVNDFNIRARYPEQKLTFYKRATKSFTNRYFSDIKVLYSRLCQKLPRKK